MAEVHEGILLGIGNPLLDITITTDESFLHKYGLEPNDAIIAGPKQQGIFSDMIKDHEPTYVAGGATQNSIRVAQWILQRPLSTTFFGCVGEDRNAEILYKVASDDGVNVRYQVDKKQPTGVCGAVITGENRSLVADLGAADRFCHSFLEDSRNWKYVQNAQVFYIGGFVFPTCTQSIMEVAKHAADTNKTLIMNLSAPFLCKYFADTSIDVMQYIDILFGNDAEAKLVCSLRGIHTDNMEEIALEIAKLPKKNTKRSRIVIFTQGHDPTIVAQDGKVNMYPVNPIDKSLIRDTNGCGDSFVGGFIAQYAMGKPIDECLRCARYAAKVVLQHWGCTYPSKPDSDFE